MTNPSTTTTPNSSTPFPTDATKPAAAPVAATPPSNDAKGSNDGGATDVAAPVIDGLIKRFTQSAHDAVDSVAAKVTSVSEGLQGGVDKAGDTRDEWIESARQVVREHPLAVVAGALVVGAALLSLRSSRRD